MEGRHRPAQSELEAAEQRREDATSSVGRALDAMVDQAGVTGKVRSAWRVRRVWDAVNGDVERASTTGIYVSEPRRKGELPKLVVYVDTRTRAWDFMANREIYRARLANAGLHFEEVTFKPNRRPVASKEEGGPSAKAPAAPAPALPELSPADAARAQDLLATQCPDVSEKLRETIQRAMNLSLRARREE